MNRESIIERLLNQGHITIKWADIILNKKERCIERITELHTDGNINTNEAVLLLNENVIVPIITIPDFSCPPPNMPYIPYPPGTGTPPNIWCQTTTDGTTPPDNYPINEKE
jgi:hypothetical protein